MRASSQALLAIADLFTVFYKTDAAINKSKLAENNCARLEAILVVDFR